MRELLRIPSKGPINLFFHLFGSLAFPILSRVTILPLSVANFPKSAKEPWLGMSDSANSPLKQDRRWRNASAASYIGQHSSGLILVGHQARKRSTGQHNLYKWIDQHLLVHQLELWDISIHCWHHASRIQYCPSILRHA